MKIKISNSSNLSPPPPTLLLALAIWPRFKRGKKKPPLLLPGHIVEPVTYTAWALHKGLLPYPSLATTIAEPVT